MYTLYFGFYVLQERELRRFNEEQRAVAKERQMTKVFNKMSDAIILVEN